MRARLDDGAPALVKAVANYIMTPPPGAPGPGVLELLRIRSDLARRLAGPQMQRTWSYLKRCQVREPYVLAQWRLMNAVAKIPDESATSADKASALLFHFAVNVFSSRPPVFRRADVEKKAEWLRLAADRCRDVAEGHRAIAQRHPHAGKWYAQRAEAFSMVGDYFEEQWNLNVGAHPSILDRPAAKVRKPGRGHKVRRDDGTRVQVVALTEASGRLYRDTNRGMVANIAAVALRNESIDLPTVTKWHQAYRRGPAAARKKRIPKKRQKKFSALPGAQKPFPSTLKTALL
jgi:hypothetical protein